MKKKALAMVLSLVMGMSLMVGCGKAADSEAVPAAAEPAAAEPAAAAEQEPASETEPPAEKEEASTGGVYGCAVPNATNSFYATCVKGVEEGIKQFDPTAQVVITDANFDSQKQLDQVADLVSQEVKAIILIPIDSNAILPAIQEAEAAGIPVTVMDTPAGETTGVVSTVVSNNYSAGEIAGRALCKAMGGKGNIVTITTTGSDAINNRKQGLYDVIEKEYPDIKIVQEEMVQNGTTEEALTIMENILQGGTEVNGVFTTGDVFAIGICSALQANGYDAGEIKVTSIDGTTNAVELIKSGYLEATAAQLPKELGIHCVKNALDYLNGAEVPAVEELDCLEVNKDNAATYQGF